MSDKKQSDAEQRWWHKVCSWIKRWWFSGIVLVGLAIAFLIICLPYLSPERRITNDHTVLLWYLGSLAVTCGLFLCLPKIVTSSTKKYFIIRVLVTGITGGVLALLLPVAVKSTTTGVGGLRHSILLATGGLIAIFTLGETRRKNDIDKKKNKQEKKKNDKDHRRQIRAERRERYTKAVEQLGSKESSVRMGGVYTLVGLVDEWLEEESISEEERLKEGQVIINNLCAYIRSPFTLASHYDELSQDTPKTEMVYKDNQQKSYKKWQIISNNLYTCIRSRFNSASRYDELSQDNPTAFYKDKEQEFYADKAKLKSEADVRRSIIKEIHDRLQGPEENTPGKWSDFEYDFSGSTFFYPIDLTNSYYTKPINFGGSTYKGLANFSKSIYEKDVIFSTSESRSTYEGEANFSGSTYKGLANFSGPTYKGLANFSGSTYEKGVTFSTSYFSPSIYVGKANFSNSTYMSEADFSGSTYLRLANFDISTYQWAEFSDSIYCGKADFIVSTYQGADFSGSIFYQEIYFGEVRDSSSFSRFTECAPIFYKENFYGKKFYEKIYNQKTFFGSLDNNFTTENGRGYPIYRNLEGLPLGCKFLTSEQKEDLKGKIQEIEETNNKLLEVKDPKEKAELSKDLQSFNDKLHEWREKNTTVKAEDVAAENTES